MSRRRTIAAVAPILVSWFCDLGAISHPNAGWEILANVLDFLSEAVKSRARRDSMRGCQVNKKIPLLLVAITAGYGGAAQAQAQMPADATESASQTVVSRWTGVINSDVRYYAWSNSLGGKGAQLYAPAAMQFTGRPDNDWKLDFLVRSGAIWSRQSTPTSTAEASSLTDTALSGTFTYLGLNGIQPFFSMNVNVPTAKSGTGTLQTTKNDSDIVATPVFGEGWNLGPSLGASFAIDPTLIATLSIGYVNRGPFSQGWTATTGPRRLDPGDVATINTGIGYRGERWVVQATLSYSMETTTYADTLPLYRSGDRVIANVKAGYAWNDNWSSRIAGSFSHFGKNKVPASANVSDLVREAFNSNSDVYRVTFDTSYSKGNYSVGPTVTFLYRDRNGYDPVTYQFIPAKDSWSAGVVGQIATTDRITFTGRIERIWVHENVNPDKYDQFNVIVPGSGMPQFVTNAWVMTVGGSAKF